MPEKKQPIISASPQARKFARELGADIHQIHGSQREGRVSEDDIRSFIKASLSEKVTKKQAIVTQEYDHSEFGEIDIQQIPRIKKIAGPHLIKSWNEIPHVTHHDEADITELEEFRTSLRDIHTGEKIKITPLAFTIRALVKALMEFPNFNSSLDIENQKIILKKYFHIGIAVDTPHGLMVPKIRDVDKKDINAISSDLKRVSEACKNLKIDKKEFFGGSITISNLGNIGGSFFTPIINQPEVAILGIGRAETKQVFINGKYENKIMLPLSLSYDHRIIDGAEGARFCVHLKESLGKDFAYKLAV
jgi:pyruvate dehydrogenase E2 component (dihydrolipoamide acetyltransferase)|uniref:Putative 2-oxoacid dehydrogenase acyltransferase (Catalytic domain) n=1 Tax=uncultured marine microorganism HF4000_010L19 TaxID=455518 RepID=B3T1N3_9ZZZZ|nr:putative 2-oxoacid dehydrogenase acyltransferase (catalytic domain) [uncultured marine microorganism HF4000_010L19]